MNKDNALKNIDLTKIKCIIPLTINSEFIPDGPFLPHSMKKTSFINILVILMHNQLIAHPMTLA
jgi:hypothetical protein